MKRINDLETVLVMMTGFAILASITRIPGFLLPSVLAGFISLLSDNLTGSIAKWWFKISHMLGFVTSRIFLTLIFFLILFPVALLARVRGSVSIQKRNNLSSYWTERNILFRKEDLENPW